MKKKIKNIFLKKKILIYGLGKSGISSFRFLRNKADIYLFDDLKNTHPKQISKLKLLKMKINSCLYFYQFSKEDLLIVLIVV